MTSKLTSTKANLARVKSAKPNESGPEESEPEESESIEQITTVEEETEEILDDGEYREVFISMASGAPLPNPGEIRIEDTAGSVRELSQTPSPDLKSPMAEPKETPKEVNGVFMVSLRSGRVIVSGIASGQDYLFEKGQPVLVDIRDVGDLEGKRRSSAQITVGENRVFKRLREE